ncbi:restriction endonuclease [Dyella monticola]|uniref:Restriction endonuclease n=1 Tax=Dyella monticola TaxID=1927958 RepID=A0A370X9M2_9GAMM|nr:restriction endonuclease [Dyella monticola]RDS84925.1 restriction endonuclease [Dyella monticola]
MGRRKDSGIEMVSKLPWQAGIVLGATGYVAMRYGLGWCMTTFGGPIGQALGNSLDDGAYAPVAWLLLIACWLAALVSFMDGRRRRRLLASQTGLRSLSAMDWREFEMLVGEAFRRQGYKVREIGLGGADGGVDLILHRDGTTTLVQCKQWRTKLVDVRIVREMYGLQMHHGADAVKIVAIGHFTDDAQRFVQGKQIELVSGPTLFNMVRECQAITRK